MNRYAVVIDGIVDNLVSCDPGVAATEGYIFADGVYVGVGFTYSEEDGFRPPKPFASWSWGYCEECGGVYTWIPPVPFPEDGARGSLVSGTLYAWDESITNWVEVVE
jgi:hypothetical protein